MEIKAIDISPLRFCVVVAGHDGVCAQCQKPVLPGKLGVMNEEMTAICCWPCIGLGIEDRVKPPPLVSL